MTERELDNADQNWREWVEEARSREEDERLRRQEKTTTSATWAAWAAAIAAVMSVIVAILGSWLLAKQNAAQIDPQFDVEIWAPDHLMLKNSGVHPVVDVSIDADIVLMAGEEQFMFIPLPPEPIWSRPRFDPREEQAVSIEEQLAHAAENAELNRKLKPSGVPPGVGIDAYLALTVTYHRAVDHKRYEWTQEVVAFGRDGDRKASLSEMHIAPDSVRAALRRELNRWRSARTSSSGTSGRNR